MLEITFDILHVRSDEELARSGPMPPIDELFVGAIVFGDTSLRLEPVPLIHAMQALVRSVHILLFYSTETMTSLDLSGATVPMRREGNSVEIRWGGTSHRFDIIELAAALGRAVVALVHEIAVKKPDYGPGTHAFNCGGQELADAIAGYKWRRDF